MTEQTETICVIEVGRGLDFSRRVSRVFRSAEAAYRWRNRQDRNYTMRWIPGRVKVGYVLPSTLETRIFE